jgi:hypothetical protein
MRIKPRATLQNILNDNCDVSASGLFARSASAALIAALALFGAAAPALADDSIGGAKMVVNDVTGDLGASGKVNVIQGDDVFRNEGVQTDADSSARLILRDNTNLLLGPNSSIKLDRFVYDGPSQPGAIAVNLVKGALRFATGDADKKAYVISTPTAALGVRGTVLKIVADGTKTLVLLDEGGAIACTHKAEKKKCLELTEEGQVVAVTANEVVWASGSAAGVNDLFISFPTPGPGPGPGPGGGNTPPDDLSPPTPDNDPGDDGNDCGDDHHHHHHHHHHDHHHDHGHDHHHDHDHDRDHHHHHHGNSGQSG